MVLNAFAPVNCGDVPNHDTHRRAVRTRRMCSPENSDLNHSRRAQAVNEAAISGVIENIAPLDHATCAVFSLLAMLPQRCGALTTIRAGRLGGLLYAGCDEKRESITRRSAIVPEPLESRRDAMEFFAVLSFRHARARAWPLRASVSI
jgi:hypothetical protein